jgi:hypothetical protein
MRMTAPDRLPLVAANDAFVRLGAKILLMEKRLATLYAAHRRIELGARRRTARERRTARAGPE